MKGWHEFIVVKAMALRQKKSELFLPAFFALAACSFMPHLSCHYYRLETHSTFIVDGFIYSPVQSFFSILFYAGLISLNILAVIKQGIRLTSLFATGFVHVLIGLVHATRLIHPFRFEVFGYNWPEQASLREVLIVFPFGLVCCMLWLNLRKTEKI